MGVAGADFAQPGLLRRLQSVRNASAPTWTAAVEGPGTNAGPEVVDADARAIEAEALLAGGPPGNGKSKTTFSLRALFAGIVRNVATLNVF